MSAALRKLHRRIAPILFLPLLASALTGVAYRLGRSWFGIPDSAANFFMVIHQGEYLGLRLVPVYVLLVGLGLVAMIVTGLTMLKRRANHHQAKKINFWETSSDSCSNYFPSSVGYCCNGYYVSPR